jgi:hypothetical protein
MNKILIMIIFIVLFVLGFFISDFLFEDKERLTIEDIITNTSRYIGQEVEVRGTAREHSANNWIKLEDKGNFIYVKHNIMNEYFKFGEKYQVKGVVKIGEVVFEEGDKVYIDVEEKEDIIRNNSLGWI